MLKLYIFICSLFVSYNIYSQTPALLLDINTTGNSVKSTTAVFEFNGSSYFSADDGVHGPELWKTDGTTSGTSCLLDINEGAYGSYPHEFAVIGNKMLFGATDNSGLEDLWITDGTTAGTESIKSISPYYNPASGIRAITPFGTKAFFIATDGTNGSELWVTDGTSDGTMMLKDIDTIPDSGGLDWTSSFMVLNNKIYFEASESIHGRELWESDGTAAGTKLLKDIYPGAESGLDYLTDFTLLNGKFYFSAKDEVHGFELWESDGTEAGTQLVKDIKPGSASGFSPSFQIFPFKNKIYFQADNGDISIGRELWSSDGTSGGTQLLKDINTGSNYSDAKYFSELNGKLYFWAMKNTSPFSTIFQFWMTDGTSDGTVVAADTYPGNYTSGLTKVYNGNLYTTYSDATYGYQLFRFDPGSASLKMLSPAAPAIDACNAGGLGTTFSVSNGKFFYPAVYDASKGIELYTFSTASNGIETNALSENACMFPVPADKQMNIYLEPNIREVKIIDAQGQVVLSVPSGNKLMVSFDCSSLTPGIYIARFEAGEHTFSRTFIVKH
ncbi:MAG: T9SS type A sorting domain-containing protein [Bacteroidetes bacterium]|nr:T9SS type A sorting domain-containing protein [Bacteroidota bacterium]